MRSFMVGDLKTATIMELRYSILPYPSGCFLSGCFAPSFAPIIVTTDERASDRLFTASRITAMEFERKPTNALNPTRNRFVIIPTTLVRTIVLSLSADITAMSSLLLLISSSFNDFHAVRFCLCISNRGCQHIHRSFSSSSQILILASAFFVLPFHRCNINLVLFEIRLERVSSMLRFSRSCRIVRDKCVKLPALNITQ